MITVVSIRLFLQVSVVTLLAYALISEQILPSSVFRSLVFIVTLSDLLPNTHLLT